MAVDPKYKTTFKPGYIIRSEELNTNFVLIEGGNAFDASAIRDDSIDTSAITLRALNQDVKDYFEHVCNKGIVNGYAPLDASGLIPNCFINTTVKLDVQKGGVACANDIDTLNFQQGFDITESPVGTVNIIGVNQFINLTDVEPTSYMGYGHCSLTINAGETGVEFTTNVSTDEKVGLCVGDIPGYLLDKLSAGTGISLDVSGTFPNQCLTLNTCVQSQYWSRCTSGYVYPSCGTDALCCLPAINFWQTNPNSAYTAYICAACDVISGTKDMIICSGTSRLLNIYSGSRICICGTSGLYLLSGGAERTTLVNGACASGTVWVQNYLIPYSSTCSTSGIGLAGCPWREIVTTCATVCCQASYVSHPSSFSALDLVDKCYVDGIGTGSWSRCTDGYVYPICNTDVIYGLNGADITGQINILGDIDITGDVNMHSNLYTPGLVCAGCICGGGWTRGQGNFVCTYSEACIPTTCLLKSTMGAGSSYSTHSPIIVDTRSYLVDDLLGRIYIQNIANPASPVALATMCISNLTAVDVSGNMLYTINSDTLTIYDVSDTNNIITCGSYASGSDALYTLGLSGNCAFSVDNNGYILSYDISDPTNPVEAYDAESVITWSNELRRIAQMRICGNYAYISSVSDLDGITVTNALTIVDISSTPVKCGELALPVQTEDGAGENVGSISVQGNYLYFGGSRASTCCSVAQPLPQWYVVDISDVCNPAIAATICSPYGAVCVCDAGGSYIGKLFPEACGNSLYVAQYGNSYRSCSYENYIHFYDISNPLSPNLQCSLLLGCISYHCCNLAPIGLTTNGETLITTGWQCRGCFFGQYVFDVNHEVNIYNCALYPTCCTDTAKYFCHPSCFGALDLVDKCYVDNNGAWSRCTSGFVYPTCSTDNICVPSNIDYTTSFAVNKQGCSRFSIEDNGYFCFRSCCNFLDSGGFLSYANDCFFSGDLGLIRFRQSCCPGKSAIQVASMYGTWNGGCYRCFTICAACCLSLRGLTVIEDGFISCQGMAVNGYTTDLRMWDGVCITHSGVGDSRPLCVCTSCSVAGYFEAKDNVILATALQTQAAIFCLCNCSAGGTGISIVTPAGCIGMTSDGIVRYNTCLVLSDDKDLTYKKWVVDCITCCGGGIWSRDATSNFIFPMCSLDYLDVSGGYYAAGNCGITCSFVTCDGKTACVCNGLIVSLA